MKFKKSAGGHWALIIFLGALAILFISMASLLSSVEEFSELSKTAIGIIKNIGGK